MYNLKYNRTIYVVTILIPVSKDLEYGIVILFYLTCIFNTYLTSLCVIGFLNNNNNNSSYYKIIICYFIKQLNKYFLIELKVLFFWQTIEYFLIDE